MGTQEEKSFQDNTAAMREVRPSLSLEGGFRILALNAVQHPAVIGIRGWYSEADGNARGIWDDAIFVAGGIQVGTYGFAANCDPSHYDGETAELLPGIYRYRMGIHGLQKPKELQYEALVQEQEVRIRRASGAEETGFFGINIHRGGYRSTGSAGCQTIHPDQWGDFLHCVKYAMQAFSLRSIPYILIESRRNLFGPASSTG